MKKKKIICVVGATASRKTGLGMVLAKKFNGEIISADSRQVYRGLDIGTGKEGLPAKGAVISNSKLLISNQISNSKTKTQSSKQINNSTIQQLGNRCRFIDGIPQWLIDICDPEQNFSMFDWLELAKIVLDDIWSRGKIPIVVGGTGLYVQALIEGFEVIQKSNIKSQNFKSKVKKYSREELDAFKLAKIKTIANKLQAESYKLDMSNPRRLIRFIERAQAGEAPSKKQPDFEFILIGRDLPREELYKKIDDRVEEWFKQGFYEEVKGLLNSGVSFGWLNKIGLEYKILAQFITQNPKTKTQNCLEYKNMKQEMKWKIHQYARRQLIWWRRFNVVWIEKSDQAVEVCQKFLDR